MKRLCLILVAASLSGGCKDPDPFKEALDLLSPVGTVDGLTVDVHPVPRQPGRELVEAIAHHPVEPRRLLEVPACDRQQHHDQDGQRAGRATPPTSRSRRTGQQRSSGPPLSAPGSRCGII